MLHSVARFPADCRAPPQAVGEAWDRISEADVEETVRRAEEAISACADKEAIRAAVVNMDVLRATNCADLPFLIEGRTP
jgi:hypothetical protein